MLVAWGASASAGARSLGVAPAHAGRHCQTEAYFLATRVPSKYRYSRPPALTIENVPVTEYVPSGIGRRLPADRRVGPGNFTPSLSQNRT
jgi:hypothetical protein